MTSFKTEESNRTVPILWIVVPCYNEEEVLPETSNRLAHKMDSYIKNGLIASDSKVLFVDDGSKDKTWSLIRDLSSNEVAGGWHQFCGLRLAHNAGHQNALYAGLMHARAAGCDCAVSLDADLQDDVNAVDEMLSKYMSGAEIVYGVRDNRDTDTRFKRGTARAFYRLMKMLGTELVPDSADFRLMGRRSLEALSEFSEANLFLRGIVPSLGFSTAFVTYRRGERFAGESKYPLRKMVSFALEGITSFSVVPLRLVSLLGIVSVLIAITMMLWTLFGWLAGDTVPGWASLMISIWFMGGLILVSVGIVGEYVGRAYLEAKDRPRYIIGEVVE